MSKINIVNLVYIEGKEYTGGGRRWTVKRDELVDKNGHDIHYSHTMKEISEMSFVEVEED